MSAASSSRCSAARRPCGRSRSTPSSRRETIAKLTTREQQGQQVAYWDYSTGLDLLYALKAGLQDGLYATKTEIAMAQGPQFARCPCEGPQALRLDKRQHS
jgi:hypothetical protein